MGAQQLVCRRVVHRRQPAHPTTLHARALEGVAKRQCALQDSGFQKSNASHVTLPKRAAPSSSLAWLLGRIPFRGHPIPLLGPRRQG